MRTAKTVEEKLTFWRTTFGIVALFAVMWGIGQFVNRGNPTIYSSEAQCQEATGQLCDFRPARTVRNWDGYTRHSSFWYPVERD